MQKRMALVVSLTLGLAICTSAWAQNAGQGNQNRNGGKQETIRGVVAGVTAIGETEFNPRTNQAQAVEASYLEIIGTPAGESRHHEHASRDSGDQNANNKNESEHGARHHRDNLYVIWLTPQTKFSFTGDHSGRREASNRDNTAGQPISFEDLQLGDHVEVTFDQSEAANARGARTTASNSPTSQKHGRNRVYFGDAVSIKVLPARWHHDGHPSEHEGGSSDHHR